MSTTTKFWLIFIGPYVGLLSLVALATIFHGTFVGIAALFMIAVVGSVFGLIALYHISVWFFDERL